MQATQHPKSLVAGQGHSGSIATPPPSGASSTPSSSQQQQRRTIYSYQPALNMPPSTPPHSLESVASSTSGTISSRRRREMGPRAGDITAAVTPSYGPFLATPASISAAETDVSPFAPSTSSSDAGAMTDGRHRSGNAKSRRRAEKDVLDTPRKGRRIANVHLGWGTPLLPSSDRLVQPLNNTPGSVEDLLGAEGDQEYSSQALPRTPKPMPKRRSKKSAAVALEGSSSRHSAATLVPAKFYTGSSDLSFFSPAAAASRGMSSARPSHPSHHPQQQPSKHSQRILTKATLHDLRGWATALSLQQAPDASALAYLAASGEGRGEHELEHEDRQSHEDRRGGESDARFAYDERYMQRRERCAHHPHSYSYLHNEVEANDLLEEYLVGFKTDSSPPTSVAVVSAGLGAGMPLLSSSNGNATRTAFQGWPDRDSDSALSLDSFASASFSAPGLLAARSGVTDGARTKMVAMHIEGVGRVAVARAVAPAVSSAAAAAALASSSSCHANIDSTSSSTSSMDTSASTTESASTALTQPATTSAGADSTCGATTFASAAARCAPASASTTMSGPSPSLSIASQFPASECGSPSVVRARHVGRGGACAGMRAMTMINGLTHSALADAAGELSDRTERHVSLLGSIIARTQRQQSRSQQQSTMLSSASAAAGAAAAAFKPRLAHHLSPLQARLPALDWPDSPCGPWSAAIEHANARRLERLQIVKMWLASHSDEGDEGGDEAEDEEADHEAVLQRQHLPRQRSHSDPSSASASAVAVPDDSSLSTSQQAVSDRLHVVPHHRTRGASGDRLRHPMISKALADRARKAAIREAEAAAIAAQSVAALPSSAAASAKTGASSVIRAGEGKQAKSKGKGKGKGSKRVSKRKRIDSDERYMALSTPLPLSRHDASAAFVGCFCGLNEETAPMVQCDTCERWYHMPCVGFKDTDNPDEQWHCHGCVVRTSAKTTPLSSAYSGGLASINTPSILRSHRFAINQMSQRSGEPVFAQPTNSPIAARSDGLASALALAPSPPILSSARHGASRNSAAAGRARAERFGWQLHEPGSPLERKSVHSASHSCMSTGLLAAPVSSRVPTDVTCTHQQDPVVAVADAHAIPNALAAGLQRSDWNSPMRTSSRNADSSLQFGFASTPSRGSTRGSAHSAFAAAARPVLDSSDDELVTDAVVDDIFSTPSRLDHGSVWPSSVTPRAAAQTPSRSARLRENSHGWGLPGALSTPSRDFLGGVFSTEHSAYSIGMPSLVYSSGGLDQRDVGDKMDPQNRAWLLQSPSSSTRAARARGVSNGFYGSSLLRTPELHNRTLGSPTAPSVSSVRDTHHERESSNIRTDLFSSSPLIKTPRGDDERRYPGGALSSLSGIQIPASSKKLARIAGMDRDSDKEGLGEPMGLGIGIDLDDDVFKWKD
ncbi:hypothetical protein K437DRAFT_163321 [Tilletiaria anomala UBC 951]|uniref:PHD-type domain-containing protein n=1 Tax=Tilletiaria anomala (strain ATCC 24038 / CBS 436.72 / UBC 951) TaxID=1037660 RepID=A0A066WFJ1_TILAU|nr:uncharacterized protein K437DRAFT_163321 [Tilletiaria anomala UBC 951]KDN52742.1 hypothetical protein K437DRAFT_163321 [Tilletiaria anomala UBC 951]